MIGQSSWLDLIQENLNVNGGDTDNASACDYVMHCLTFTRRLERGREIFSRNFNPLIAVYIFVDIFVRVLSLVNLRRFSRAGSKCSSPPYRRRR